MKLSELKDFLAEYPDDAEVVIRDPDTEWLLHLIYVDLKGARVVLGSDYGEQVHE